LHHWKSQKLCITQTKHARVIFGMQFEMVTW